jgi:hypothetical protein
MNKQRILLSLFFLVLLLSGCTLTKSSLQTPISSNTALPSNSPTPVLSPLVTASDSSIQIVPLPSGEDIIRVFFELINEKRIPEAIEMMDPAVVVNDSTKQAWGVTFNHFKAAHVEKIEEYDKSSWTESLKTYKATFTLETDAPAEQIIWENGVNIRWIDLKKVGNLWKIVGFASGP